MFLSLTIGEIPLIVGFHLGKVEGFYRQSSIHDLVSLVGRLFLGAEID